jgi:4-hydroxy-tetrahydrodipicolinate synthase
LPATVIELASHPRIIGLKDATAELERVAVLREGCGDEFAIYSGDDATGCDLMLQGGDGVISVTANVAPALMVELCTAALAGDRDRALALNAQLDPLHHRLFAESNPIPVKWALEQMGLIQQGIRLPLTWLSTPHQAPLREAMMQAGVL